MKKLMVVLGVAFAALVVRAETYTWTGEGEGGRWTDPANWDIKSGYPGAGDTANFDANATITEAFSLGGEEGTADVLTIVTAKGATLTLSGSVSGEGGIRKTGDGSLDLRADNPFKGDFTTQGTTALTKSSIDSSLVTVYNGGALGRGKVWIDPDDTANCYGAAIIFKAGAGNTMTITNDIDIGKAQYSKSAQFYRLRFRDGSFVVSGKISNVTRAAMNGTSACTSLRFTVPIDLTGYFHLNGFGTSTDIHFEDTVSCNILYMYGCKANVHLYKGKTGNDKAPSFTPAIYSHVISEADNALDTTTKYMTIGEGGILDLNGHDQVFNYFWSGNLGGYSANGTMTSPLDKPGKLTIKYHSKAQTNNCAITGNFSLEFIGPNCTKPMTFAKSVSTTVGDLTLSKGPVKIVIQDGAQFTRLGSLSLDAKTQLTLTADGGDCRARSIYLTTGCTNNIAAGRVWRTNHLYLDGVELTEKTSYTSADLDEIVGEGSIEIEPESNEFVGDEDDDWANPANWSMGFVPGEGEHVTVFAPARLAAVTPVFAKVTVAKGSTLVFADTNACLKATDVVVEDGALVTSAGPFKEEADAARVRIDCTDLTVAEGGAIDVSSKGWSGSVYANDSSVGYGPGAGKRGYGASHGGRGGRDTLSTGVHLDYLVTYGDAAEPVTCGSGGARRSATAGNPVHGGGAVRIVATGDVVIDGAVRADGGSAMAVGADGIGKGDTGGAGGSVWITCRTISGSGTVSAAGGFGSTPILPNAAYVANNDESTYSRPGGGGRISIGYDSAAQAAKSPELKISAREGGYLGRYPDQPSSLAVDDSFLTDAEPGTLKFSDATLFNQLLGKGLSGKMLDVGSVDVDGDLDFSYGHLCFVGEGFSFKVSGDLTLSSADTRLEIGQSVLTNKTPFNCKWAGRELNRLEVGGDLSVTDGAALDVRAAEKGTLTDWGAEVKVGGAMTIGADSYVYAWCDQMKPIPVRFAVGSLTVAAGGTFSAENRGAAGGWGGTNYGNACTGGKNTYGTSNGTTGTGTCRNGGGGSHGGLGGLGFVTSSGETKGDLRTAYEPDPYEPVHTGSGGSSGGYGTSNPAAGGVIYVLSEGPIVIDGTVTADSSLFSPYLSKDYMWYSGMCAGGSIYLFGDTFASGPTARLSARGANSAAMATLGGCGGGGCIAVWTGRSNYVADTFRPRRLKKLAETTMPADLGYQGAFDVSGGTNVAFVAGYSPKTGYEQVPETHGGEGTIRFARVDPAPGILLLVR